MYCPNCAKENSAEQRFCRFCGMALQTVSKVLAEHLAASNPEKQAIKPDDGVVDFIVDRLIYKTQHRMLTMLLWGVIALVVGMGVIAVAKDNEPIGLLGLLLVLGGALLAFYGVISHLRATALASRRGAQQKALPPSEPDVAGAGRSFPEAVPSVTELTTRNLDAAPETTHEESAGNTQPTG
jgi:hypothetical protein